jgi:hypothetical protein
MRTRGARPGARRQDWRDGAPRLFLVAANIRFRAADSLGMLGDSHA